MALQPLLDLGMFMGGVIVGDDVDVEIGRALLIGPYRAARSQVRYQRDAHRYDYRMSGPVGEAGRRADRSELKIARRALIGAGRDVGSKRHKTRFHR